MEPRISKQITGFDLAAVQLSSTQEKVKKFTIKSAGGITAIGPDNTVAVGTHFDLGNGAEMSLDSTHPQAEYDLSKIWVRASGGAVVLHLIAVD
jgi:hypothetical protein